MYGKPSAMKGRKHTKNSIRKMSKTRIKLWKEKGANPSKFEKYRNKVDSLTRKQSIHLLENVEKRGKAGVDGTYHLDHIISVWHGFHNDIPPEEIADISNLRMLPWLENQKKWMNNGIID